MPNQRFKFLHDIALADVAFEAYGDTLEELFENAALALLETMIEPSSLTVYDKNLHVKIKGSSTEELLYDFLSELVFLKDTRGFLASQVNVKIDKQGNTWRLTATLDGESLNPKKHEQRVDVKAVTKHLFKIERTSDGRHKATVVLDI